MRVEYKDNIIFIDEEDLEFFNSKNWFIQEIGNTSYLVCDERKKGGKYIYFHRHVMDYPSKQLVVDHINRNGLDNRRVNLRSVNKRVNNMNSKIRSDNSIGFKGVCLSKYKNSVYYMARIKVGNKDVRKFRKCLLGAAHEYIKLQKQYA